MGGRLELVGGSPAGTYLGRVAQSGFLLARARWSAWGTEALPEWARPIKTRRPALLQFAALLQWARPSNYSNFFFQIIKTALI
jgi:hypothetical protein